MRRSFIEFFFFINHFEKISFACCKLQRVFHSVSINGIALFHIIIFVSTICTIIDPLRHIKIIFNVRTIPLCLTEFIL